MNQELWKTWVSNWNWIIKIAEERGWNVRDALEIKKPVSIDVVDKVEKANHIVLPIEFKEILTGYASKVSFTWFIEDEETTGEYREIFCGGSDPIWDLKNFKSLKENYEGWKQDCFPDIEDEYDKIWHNKTPFIHVSTGDMIAFDMEKGNSNCPVIYLSHDGSDSHGLKLGDNFVDFMARWSNIGCPGTEDWQIEPFYNYESKQIEIMGDKVNNWKKWLENK